MVHNFCYPVDISGRCLFTGTDGSGYLFPFFGEIVDNSREHAFIRVRKIAMNAITMRILHILQWHIFFVYNLCGFVDNRI